MSKKRKASKEAPRAAAEASPKVSIVIAKNPKDTAATLLSLLPSDATDQHKDAKHLFKAFEFVKQELVHRSNVMKRQNETSGATQPFLFLNGTISLPEELLLSIFGHIPHFELVHAASFVSKAWLSATRNPQLWTILDSTTGLLTGSDLKLSMSAVLSILQRPQFAQLKSLVLPGKVKLGETGMKQLAKHCPCLQEIDFGFKDWTSIHPKQKELVQLPALFPHLTKVGVGMWSLPNADVSVFVRAMGNRLVELSIRGEVICENYLADDTLAIIGATCPELEAFRYKLSDNYYEEHLDRVTEKGIQAIVNGCPKLRTLDLVHSAYDACWLVRV